MSTSSYNGSLRSGIDSGNLDNATGTCKLLVGKRGWESGYFIRRVALATSETTLPEVYSKKDCRKLHQSFQSRSSRGLHQVWTMANASFISPWSLTMQHLHHKLELLPKEAWKPSPERLHKVRKSKLHVLPAGLSLAKAPKFGWLSQGVAQLMELCDEL